MNNDNHTNAQQLGELREQIITAFESYNGDVQTKLFFDNGYGVSVIRHIGSYGYHQGLYELAVLAGTPDEYDLCYDTPITGDVAGWLTADDVFDLALQAAKL